VKRCLCAASFLFLLAVHLSALDRPGTTFKVFQFPPDQIPRIDGNTDDWNIVPDDYAIGADQLVDQFDPAHKHDPSDFDVKVRVGWVKGLNRLYFLYEAYSNYWDFGNPGLNQDLFELVVDGDLSGGPLIERLDEAPELSERDQHFSMHGVFAQNYHIMTPALGKDWAMSWGCNSYVKQLPYANAAYKYNFKPGQGGRLVLEFWITPFDYAGCEGPQRAVESRLFENKVLGMSWVAAKQGKPGQHTSFWNLSRTFEVYGLADHLVAFRLMPLEKSLQKFDANWTFKIIDMDRRLVAFQDESTGDVTRWKWDFGDGSISTEKNPIHQYPRGADYDVVLEVEGPEGISRREKIWDVDLR
jgi:hypothetical protein